MKTKRSKTMKLILALLKVYGPQPIENLIQIVYPEQTTYLPKQHQYLLRTLDHLDKEGLVDHIGKLVWSATKRK